MTDDDTPDTDDEPEYVMVRTQGENACSGPNHGNEYAQPKGTRRWMAGQCLSLTQTADTGSAYNLFCGAPCLCDWHGTFDAALQGTPEGNDPPGRFTLVWISHVGTTVGVYDDWAELTEHIGTYQKTLVDKGMI